MATVVASAPGKVHLIGEHSVVYGEPAIIAAISLRCTVSATRSESMRIWGRELHQTLEATPREWATSLEQACAIHRSCMQSKNFRPLFDLMKKKPMNLPLVASALVLEKLSVRTGANIKIRSDIPIGSGLGSSAALAVSMAKALSTAYCYELSSDEINRIAFEIEQFNHGTPSGGDNSTCCLGGLIWFEKRPPVNIIRQVEGAIPGNLSNFLLVQTRKREKKTGQLLQIVRDLPEDFRVVRVKILGRVTGEMFGALGRKDAATIKRLMNEAQQVLAELRVSTVEIDQLTEAIRRIGGGAKLSGAGGGGFVICFHEDRKRLEETIRGMGYSPCEVQLGVKGVRLEASA
ncbi:mevalonate kinase [Acidobacteriia bacterium AH_259_A11_L15]|nr:mevalonate kinase [Acidobacteriia bacterium AH_259_A11_L15]